MKKENLILLLSTFLLTSCGGTTTSTSESIEPSNPSSTTTSEISDEEETTSSEEIIPTEDDLKEAISTLKENYTMHTKSGASSFVGTVTVTNSYYAMTYASDDVDGYIKLKADKDLFHEIKFDGDGTFHDYGRVDVNDETFKNGWDLSLFLAKSQYTFKDGVFHSDDLTAVQYLFAHTTNVRSYSFGYGHEGFDIKIKDKKIEYINILGTPSGVSLPNNIFLTFTFDNFGTSKYELFENLTLDKDYNLPSPAIAYTKRIGEESEVSLYEGEVITFNGYIGSTWNNYVSIFSDDGVILMDNSDNVLNVWGQDIYHHNLTLKGKIETKYGVARLIEPEILEIGDEYLENLTPGSISYGELVDEEFNYGPNAIINDGWEVNLFDAIYQGDIVTEPDDDGYYEIFFMYEDGYEGPVNFSVKFDESAEDLMGYMEDDLDFEPDEGNYDMSHLIFTYENGKPQLYASEITNMNKHANTLESLIFKEYGLIVDDDLIPYFESFNMVEKGYISQNEGYNVPESGMSAIYANIEISEEGAGKVESEYEAALVEYGFRSLGDISCYNISYEDDPDTGEEIETKIPYTRKACKYDTRDGSYIIIFNEKDVYGSLRLIVNFYFLEF